MSPARIFQVQWITDANNEKIVRHQSTCSCSRCHVYCICYFCSSALYSHPRRSQYQMLQARTPIMLKSDQDSFLPRSRGMLKSVLLSPEICMSCRMDGFVLSTFGDISFPIFSEVLDLKTCSATNSPVF